MPKDYYNIYFNIFNTVKSVSIIFNIKKFSWRLKIYLSIVERYIYILEDLKIISWRPHISTKPLSHLHQTIVGEHWELRWVSSETSGRREEVVAGVGAGVGLVPSSDLLRGFVSCHSLHTSQHITCTLSPSGAWRQITRLKYTPVWYWGQRVHQSHGTETVTDTWGCQAARANTQNFCLMIPSKRV